MSEELTWQRALANLQSDNENGMMMLIDRVEQIEARLAALERQLREDSNDGR